VEVETIARGKGQFETMTEPAIIEKLRRILYDPVDSECKVVYILAESRKLLDGSVPNPNLFALKLYCNWALHVNLTHVAVTLPFLQGAEKYSRSILAGSTDIRGEHSALKDLVGLETFRQHFRSFLTTYDIPPNVCNDDGLWHQFLTHYAGVIEDGSLKCSIRKDQPNPLTLVEKVIVNKGRNQPGFKMPFSLVWTILFLQPHDRKGLEVETKAVHSDSGEMIVWGTKLLSH
jgi:hypothetical protein